MSGKKKGLGRGLSALFGDEKPKNKPQEISQLNTVSISDLSRNPYQPRQYFSEEKLCGIQTRDHARIKQEKRDLYSM